MTEHYFIYSTAYSIKERQTKNGTVYDAVFRVVGADGVERQKRLCGFTSRPLLKRAHADFITKYCELVTKNLELQKSKITFGEAFSQYFLYLTSAVKESSCVSIRGKFKSLILPYFEKRELNSITKQDYYQWQDSVLKQVSPKTNKPYSIRTIAHVREFLNTFLRWVQERYDIPNLFIGVKAPKNLTTSSKRSAKINFWEREEFDRFISQVDDIVYKALFSTLFFCGCRKGEAFAFSDEDYNGKELHIYKTYSNKTLDGTIYKITTTKAGRDFSVPLAQPLIVILDEYLKYKRERGISSQYLFGGDKPLPAETVRKRFSAYIALSGVPEIRIHDLRHSFASMLIHHGASYAAVAELIGDNPEQVIKTYGHLYLSDKLKLVLLI